MENQTEKPLLKLGIRGGIPARCLQPHLHNCYGYSYGRVRPANEYFVPAGGARSVEESRYDSRVILVIEILRAT
jgi:hypothetical protein